MKTKGMIEQYPLDLTQLKAVLETSVHFGARTHAMFMLCARHGLRTTELAEVKLDDINMRDKTIRVRSLKGSFTKVEAMLPGDFEALQVWLDERASHANPASELLFPSHRVHTRAHKNGEHARHEDALSRTGIYNIFRKVLEAAGMPSTSRSVHCIRHSVAQNAYDQGAPLDMVAGILRHKNVNSAARYAKLSQSKIDAAKLKYLGLAS